jgi:3-phosphoshikimate 1-carboxyvinyltransferase
MDERIKGLTGKKLLNRIAVTVPSSKSHTIRALLIASMAEGKSRLINPLDSADARSCIEACRCFGAEINIAEQTAEGLTLWTVRGNTGRFPVNIKDIDVGNSGTSLYLAAGLAALATTEIRCTGDEQIRRRPAKALLDALAELGASIRIDGDCPPFSIRGPLKGGHTSIECPTSQYLSSLLICTPLATGESIIEVPLLMEKPYVEMTLKWLDRQNIKYVNDSFKRFTITGGQRYRNFENIIPGDFSSAAFPLCAAAITGSKLSLAGLDITDSQGDKAIIEYLRKMGCNIEVAESKNGDLITIEGPEKLKPAEIDLNDTPDALPAMAVTACFAGGTTRLYNVPQARLKETDRITVMQQELSKLGADIEEREDGLVIRGGKILHGCRVDGHGDHRVVMSLAVAALAADGETIISDAEAVEITYPGFFKQLEALIKS